MELANCQSILIIKPSSLGDIVHTLPAVETIHRQAPHAEIHWVVNSEWEPILQGIPYITERIPFPRKEFRGMNKGGKALTWMKDHLGSIRPDLTLDFQGLLRSAVMARRARSRHTVGFRQAREGARFFYHRAVDIPQWHRLHAVDRNLRLAKAVGAPLDALPDQFATPTGDHCQIPGLEKTEPFVLLHPFSRGKGKSLGIDDVKKFCQQMAPFPVVIVGTSPFPDEPESNSEEQEWGDNAYDLLGKTSLSQLIDLIHRASWTVSVDSGPMHLAAAISARVLSIHTWTDPIMVGPWAKEAFVWRTSEIWRMDEIEVGQFREQRNLRKSIEEKDELFSISDCETICSFLQRQLKSPHLPWLKK